MEGDGEGIGDGKRTHSTDDLLVVCEMCFAVLAAVDSFGVEVDVVGEAHGCCGLPPPPGARWIERVADEVGCWRYSSVSNLVVSGLQFSY